MNGSGDGSPEHAGKGAGEVDWDREILGILRSHGAGLAADHLPWEPLVARYRAEPASGRQAMAERLLAMIDLDYRNPHAEQAALEEGIPALPGGMQPEDLLCLEAAAFAAVALGLPGARERLQALLREPRFHGVYPHLRRLHLELPELLRSPGAGGAK